MATISSNRNFLGSFKNYAATVTAILSFIALALGTARAVFSDLTFSAVALLAAATVLLAAYNVWLVKANQTAEQRSNRSGRYPTYRRWLVHLATVTLLTICWSVVAALASDKYAGYLFLYFGQLERASARLSSHVASTKRDFAAYRSLAAAYEKQENYSAYFRTLEELLENKEAIEQLPQKMRNRERREIHFALGSGLVFHEYNEGSSPQPVRALYHLKNAQFFGADDPICLILLAFLTAHVGDQGPTTISTVRHSFKVARAKVALYEATTVGRQLVVVYHLWFGRALRHLDLLNEAEGELSSGLELAATLSGKEGTFQKDRLLYELGAIKNGVDDVVAARRYWDRISNEKLLRTSIRHTAGAIWIKSIKAKSQGRPEEAGALYRKAEKLLSAAAQMGDVSPALYRQLGGMYFSQSDYLQAAATFQKLTQMRPSNYSGFFWLARSEFAQEDRLEQADIAMSKAVALAPKNGEAHYWLGRIATARGQYERGRTQLTRSMELGFYEEKDVYAHLVIAIASQAENASKGSDEYIALHEEALRQARLGLERLKTSKATKESTEQLYDLTGHLSNTLAYAYAQRKTNLQLALNYVDSALETSPDEPHYLDTKGWILVLIAERSKDAESYELNLRGAERLLTRALNGFPSDERMARAESLFHLGYIQKLRGQNRSAREMFINAVKLNPAHGEAKAELQ